MRGWNKFTSMTSVSSVDGWRDAKTTSCASDKSRTKFQILSKR